MHVSVVICTWNRHESLARALESLEQVRLPSDTQWEVLLVDNNSTDGTRAICESFVKKRPERYRYLFEKRQGKSFALNTAIEHAKGQILAFTDDDVTFHPDWLAEILRTFEEFSGVSGVAGKIVADWQFEKPAWMSTEGPYRLMQVVVSYDLGEVACETRVPPFGPNMALRKEVFERYGNYRTDLGPGLGGELRGEDTEFCRRLLDAGEKFIYAPRAVVLHAVGKERLEKRFFEKWYFDYGRAQARVNRVPESAVYYFQVPRYLLRQFLRYCLRWMLSIRSVPRFYFKLQMCQTLGEIMESRRLRRSRPN